MHYKTSLTPDQCESLWHWIEDGPDAAPVLLDSDGDDLLAGQGDARCRIYPDGTLCDELAPCQGEAQRASAGLPSDGSAVDPR